MQTFVGILTNGNPGQIGWALPAILLSLLAIWMLRGRGWALIYVALIPFLNWSFGIIPEFQIIEPTGSGLTAQGVSLHPMTMVTGMVFVIRDFVQREMGHRVLIVMSMAIAWSFYYAWPVIALASGIAFAISEGVDWLLFTFTKYRLSTRILLSSALAAPVDTTVFLYGADLAKQMELGMDPGNSLHVWNWVVFVIGKMVGAVIVSAIIRRREDLGKVDPAAA
ncbi:hypothetical protein HY36_01005 [Hyphomonas atlantica]|uniref:VUT family protein n=2 Tax=Hyphomonas atlantica TaxID=1280948 RepID=A0A059EBB4_9PROT|nr:hypothetical protein HY36_01005 [Hyphomonas atlantica]